MAISYLNYRLCSKDGCFLKHEGKGFCKKHYATLYESYDKRKTYHKEYTSNPINKERKLEWDRNNTDKTRQYRQKQNSKPDHSLKRKVYRQRPYVMEYERNYKNDYNNKNPEKSLNWSKNHLEKLGEIHNLSIYDMMYALQSWSKSVKKRDDKKCTECGDDKNLHAHHVLQKSIYPEFTFVISNGITVCQPCHMKIHKEERSWQ